MPGLEDKYVDVAISQTSNLLIYLSRYHWAIIVGPKSEGRDSQGIMFHAREKMAVVDGKPLSFWEFEERSTSMAPTSAILVRIVVGKVANIERVNSVFRAVRVKSTEPSWNCVSWVQEALQGLEEDRKAIGTSKIDWSSVRDAAMRYMEQKTSQHRFDGQGTFDMSKVATWDLLVGEEAVP